MLTAAIIEIRRGLRCTNIFLKFDVEISQWQQSVKIKIHPDKFTFFDPHNPACVEFSDFKVEPTSLSNLLINEYNISFRLSLIEEEESLEAKPEKLFSEDKNDISNNLKIIIEPNTPSEILCKNCQNPIVKQCEYKRVLELPSGTVDLDNFFCHNGPNLEQMLLPKNNDIFYGIYCIVINSEKLNKVRNKNELCYCEICCNYLGEFIHNGKAVNLWSDNVSLKKYNEILNVFLVDSPKQISYHILKNAFNEYDTSTNINLYQFSKILIEAIFPNGEKYYLMINILEKNLDILKFCKNKKIFEIRKCCKILFKVENVSNKALLSFWLKDIYVHRISISYQIFKNITDYLIKYSEVIPAAYRKHDCFLSSYFIYDKKN